MASISRNPKRRLHDREVLTRYVGELIQHDSSHHLWAPAAQEKWYLITSLDDYSRFILYAVLVKKETSWTHILALQTVILRYGLPYAYYVDSHSIFRFVQGRDSLWYKHHLLTDEATPQWKQVLEDCNVKVTYALSPQAKGKMERPYGWLQDRLDPNLCQRRCHRDQTGPKILNQELHRYNYQPGSLDHPGNPLFSFSKSLKGEAISLSRIQNQTPFPIRQRISSASEWIEP